MGKYSKLVMFSTQKLFQVRACVISVRKSKHLDITTCLHTLMQTRQSEHAYYLGYFIMIIII